MGIHYAHHCANPYYYYFNFLDIYLFIFHTRVKNRKMWAIMELNRKLYAKFLDDTSCIITL